jgi:hypothetical protein
MSLTYNWPHQELHSIQSEEPPLVAEQIERLAKAIPFVTPSAEAVKSLLKRMDDLAAGAPPNIIEKVREAHAKYDALAAPNKPAR